MTENSKKFPPRATMGAAVFAKMRGLLLAEPGLVNSISGITAGLCSTTIMHPLDLLKTRMHLVGSDLGYSKSTGYLDTLRLIIRKEGLTSLYKGLSPNLIGNASAWGLYFWCYGSIKRGMQVLNERQDQTNTATSTTSSDKNKSSTKVSQEQAQASLSSLQHLLAGWLAGIGVLTLTNPIWVIKTRMMLEQQNRTHKSSQAMAYKGTFDGIIRLAREEGLRGLYKGYVPGLLGTTHGGLQFMAYERLKRWRWNASNKVYGEKLTPVEYLSLGALSKIFASTMTYPYQVVRSRIQFDHKSLQPPTTNHQVAYSGAIDCIRRTWQAEGVKGFYRGLIANTIRVTPASCIVFVVYENMNHWLSEMTEIQ